MKTESSVTFNSNVAQRGYILGGGGGGGGSKQAVCQKCMGWRCRRANSWIWEDKIIAEVVKRQQSIRINLKDSKKIESLKREEEGKIWNDYWNKY